MEPVSAVLGVMASLPQCIQSAKLLYDMRARFKDASVLITAIYSESMVIAASLSQVHNLLQNETLQSKPQLLETFDRALTGCRVVYGCLQEEVKDLAAKAENDNLKFKDRAKFLWKEDNFKELLTQIRGQQTTLSLLIQGLQMESIADIRKLVADNSVKLDQVVKRSRTLRQTHPRITVPDSILTQDGTSGDATDAESILKSPNFTFDDEVINSKAYRKAMALYTSKNANPGPDASEEEVEEDDVTIVDSTQQAIDNVRDTDLDPKISSPAVEELPKSKFEENKADSETQPAQIPLVEEPDDFGSLHQHLFDSLENDILAFMPSSTSTASYLTNSKSDIMEKSIPLENSALTPAPLRQSSDDQSNAAKEDDEKPPPLPPRRPSEQPPYSSTPKSLSMSSNDSAQTMDPPSILSNVSSASSLTTWKSSQSSSTISRKPLRISLPPAPAESFIASNNDEDAPSKQNLSVAQSKLHSDEMHAVWLSLAESERKFFDQMTKLRSTFYDGIIQEWPVLEKHLEAVLIAEQLAKLNKEILLQTIEEQIASGETATCNPAIFEVWTNKSQKIYREYCQRMPHATASLRTTQNLNSKFTPFVKKLDLSVADDSTSLEDYFGLPIVQLQLYIDSLHNIVHLAETLDEPAAHSEITRLKQASEAITWLKTMTATLLEESHNRENVQGLEKRLHTLNTDYLSQLQLLEPTRRVRHQGGMAIKLKGHGPWNSVHVMLLDNYLLWGKVKSHKIGKGDKILVLDAPIAISDLELTLPAESNQFQKTTMFDKIPQGLVLYIITIRQKSSKDKPHMLGAYGFQERREWWDHFTAVAPTTTLAPVV